MPDFQHIDSFLAYLTAFHRLPNGLIEGIKRNAKVNEMKKGQVFTCKGAYDKKIGFLSEGIMRIYDVDTQGQQWNKVLLTYQTSLLGNTELNQPAIHYIDAITDCTIVELPISFLEKALEEFQELREVRSKIVSRIYQMKSERESDLLILSTKDRFLKLKDNIGDTIENIPQYHIASFLGITPIQLSRIKSSLGA